MFLDNVPLCDLGRVYEVFEVKMLGDMLARSQREGAGSTDAKDQLLPHGVKIWCVFILAFVNPKVCPYLP